MEYSGFSFQSIIQALGRPREGLLESVVVVKPGKHTEHEVQYEVLDESQLIENAWDELNTLEKTYQTNPIMLKDKLENRREFVQLGKQWIVDEHNICNPVSVYKTKKLLFDGPKWREWCNTISVTNHIIFTEVEDMSYEMPNPMRGATLGERIKYYIDMPDYRREHYLFQTQYDMRQGAIGRFDSKMYGTVLAAEVLIKLDNNEKF